jgi:hypothetical protein
MQKRRKILIVIIFLFVALGIFFVWLVRGNKMMDADIIASNGSHYKMQLPNDMEPTHTNDSAASLEYGNAKKQLYVEVIGDSKAKIISFGLDYDLETYMKIATRQLDNEGLYVNNPTTINGYKALQAEIVPKTNNSKNIHYKLTCIESSKFFYQIVIYSPAEFFEKNKSDIDKIIYSFKEVDQ